MENVVLVFDMANVNVELSSFKDLLDFASRTPIGDLARDDYFAEALFFARNHKENPTRIMVLLRLLSIEYKTFIASAQPDARR